MKAAHRDRITQLLHKMRRGECNVTETFLLHEDLQNGAGHDEIDALLQEIGAENNESPRDAWIVGAMLLREAGELEQDADRAMKILTPHKQDPLCAALLGGVHEYLGNCEPAHDCYLRSADAGCAEGLYAYGCYWVATDDDIQYVDSIRTAAAMMHPGAMRELGLILCSNDDGAMFPEQALQLYAQASALGDRESTYLLAVAYHTGDGVRRDLRRAARLYRHAIMQGYGVADVRLNRLKRSHPHAVIPYGEWRPDEFLHRWVSDEMHHQMRTVLLMHARQGSVFAMLPRVLLPLICFWLCTDPTRIFLPRHPHA